MKPLCIVIDVSGSMLENGKHLIAYGVVRSTAHYLSLGYGSADLKLLAWRNDATSAAWNPDREFPGDFLLSEETANTEGFIKLLTAQPDGKVMVVTDGFWAPEDARILKSWRSHLRPEALRVIKVGVDANPHLKGADVFHPEDLFAALDGWLEEGTT